MNRFNARHPASAAIVAIGMITACLFSSQVNASSAAGYVNRTAFTGSRVFVWVDAVRDGASCNTPGAGERYEIDGGSSVGQSQLSIILTAQALHKQVLLLGTNGCAIDTESIGYLEVRP